MEFTEIFSNVWTWIVGVIGMIGVPTITGIIAAFSAMARQHKITQNYYDSVENLVGNATQAGINQIKNITFKNDIQPLVESELKKVYEYSIAVLETSLKAVQGQYGHVVDVLEALAKYFDNSIGVSEDAKAELKEAIEEAKNSLVSAEPVESEVVIVASPEPVSNEENSGSNNTNAIR